MASVAFLFYLLFVFIRPQEFVQSLSSLPVVKVTLISVFLLMFFDKQKRFDGPQTAFLFFFVICIFLSSVANGWIMGGVYDVQEILTISVLPFFIVCNVLNTTSRQKIVMLFLIIASVVMVSNGISQKASQSGIGWSGAELSQGTRITYLGILNDPNDLGMFLAMTFPMIFYFLKYSNFLLRLLSLIAGLIIIYGIYLTNSRGSMLALFSLLGGWFLIKFGLKKSFIAGAFSIPIVFLVMSRFRQIDSEEASAAGRLDAWYQGIQMLLSNPLLGVGQNAFRDYHHLTAHNSFVLVFSELGLLGYFFWLGFVLFCALSVLLLWNKKIKGSLESIVPEQEKSIALCLSFSLLAFFVTGFFLSRSYTPVLYIFCGFMVATFYRSVTIAISKESLNLSIYSGLLLKLFLGSIIGIYVVVKLLA